eukprot:TRINITY_DN84374_c0_g1_i1.p1 TRINITY_DN84374_c0_g1~~TRINITY_DN84374_c0_g1_i1.p1  ORF type:complete len:227 (+),score=57.64 TRINITY_DN84374_c0_g1_i1:55-735(+)
MWQMRWLVWLLLRNVWMPDCEASSTKLPKKRKQGSLGPGSEALDKEEAQELLSEYRKGFTEDGDPLRRRGEMRACSACEHAARRFQSKVASKIKGKMPDAEKRSVFMRGLDAACSESLFPEQMAVVEKKGQEMYVDFREALGSQHGKVSVKEMSPEIKAEVIAACRHVLQKEFKDALLKKVLATPKGGRASDINFRSLLCGPKMAKVCKRTGEDADEDEDEADEEL